MAMEHDRPDPKDLEPREPTLDDLVGLCRRLNVLKVAYLVVGGFAMRAAGYIRQTMDIDLVVAGDPDNEQRLYQALAGLPDNAVRDLRPGELERYAVIRVADEIVVDLMTAAGGIAFAEACRDVARKDIHGVSIPFASPRLLWRMKARTHREKDAPDLLFLRRLLEARGETPPAD